MLALERLDGLRVVARPDAIDGARWTPAEATILRIAPDDALAIGAQQVDVDDPDAIVEVEAGFVGAWLTAAQLRDVVVPRIEWPLPSARPVLAQGSIAGVPARLWLGSGAEGEGHERTGRTLLIVQAAYADELQDRLR